MQTYPDTLEMLTISLKPGMDEFLRINPVTSWDTGDMCTYCGEPFRAGECMLEYVAGGCDQIGCEHADEDGECSLIVHKQIHFRHFGLDVLPSKERELALRHWGKEALS